MTEIVIRYRACDGFAETRKFRTLAGAQKYAKRMIGGNPDRGRDYAVSSDGVGTVRVSGATMDDIFGRVEE